MCPTVAAGCTDLEPGPTQGFRFLLAAVPAEVQSQRMGANEGGRARPQATKCANLRHLKCANDNNNSNNNNEDNNDNMVA
ncbi:GH20272 [Drosophila grimshawi]|uniref:GH20272 n=1 Tax=Drosophila grimshawi TaxID=7222 RepID=B4J5D0_DROGR|nr:GH20272 [Drosophila grimshawi]